MNIPEQQDLLSEAQTLFNQLAAHPDIQKKLAEKGKTMDGGYLCAARDDGIPVLIYRIGNSPKEKVASRIAFCQEKAARIVLYPEHRLSRESADEAKEQYPGAVRASNERILSFSGLPGHLDELFMILLAVRMNYMAKMKARKIIARHPNDYVTGQIIKDFLMAAGI